VPLGVDLGGSGPVAAPAPPPVATSRTPAASSRPGMQMAHDGHEDAHGIAMVNSVDAAGHKVNLSHQPIPEIGWPAMTMDFGVAPTVDLRAIKPGARVNFTIEKGPGGMYQVQAITPAGGAR
jgi:Cu/Ag efflux protein CusF